MAHVSDNRAEIRRRLRAYIQTLNLDCGSDCIETILASGETLAVCLESLRKQLAENFGGDFLAFRLHQGFAVNEANFRQPVLERQPLTSAPLGHSTPSAMD